MDLKIAEVLENLGPAKVVVVLILLDIALVILHGIYPFDDGWFVPLYYSIAAVALLAFFWYCAVAIRMLLKWRKEKAAGSPAP